MPVEWIEHKGKRIMFIDHRECSSQEMINNIDLSAEMLQDIPSGVKCRYLANIEGATIDTNVMTRLKQVGKEFDPKVERSALVGVRGIRNILVQGFNRVTGAGKTQKLFDTQEEALEWLASD